MSSQNYVVLGLGVILASANGESYCDKNCQEVYHNCTNPEFQLCLSAQSDCGVDSSTSLILNVVLGILALIGIIAIVIRCCMFARLLGGKKSGKSGCDKEQETLQQQNNVSAADAEV